MLVRAFLLALLVAVPATGALPLPAPDAPSTASLVLDTTAYREEVDRALQWTLRFQKPDGGVYEYEFLQKDTNAASALRLYARAQSLDLRGPEFTALVDYWEASQRMDGSWGSGLLVPHTTSDVTTGLLDAGYDLNSTVLQRALFYVESNQGLDGAWADGNGAASASLTAQNLAILLRAGHPRSGEATQAALSWLLSLQDPATGGFPPEPGWFTTPAATALVLRGLDAYLLAPATGPEGVAQADVQTAADRAIAHLGATWDAQTGQWQHGTGATCLVLGPAARYHSARGLALPAWLEGAAEHVVGRMDASGAVTNAQGTRMLEWTLIGAAGLLEVPRDLRSRDSLRVQTTHNEEGAYDARSVTLTLRDASGKVLAERSGPAGFETLSWSKLPAGWYVVRAEAEGAAATERVLWRV